MGISEGKLEVVTKDVIKNIRRDFCLVGIELGMRPSVLSILVKNVISGVLNIPVAPKPPDERES